LSSDGARARGHPTHRTKDIVDNAKVVHETEPALTDPPQKGNPVKPKIFLTWLLVAASPCVFAAKEKPPINATNKDQFSHLIAEVHAEMKPSGRYAEVNRMERERVDMRLADMTTIFAKAGDVEHMSKEDKIAFFNAQEEVNGILLKRDGDRLICVNEARSGTHFKNTKCRTAREVEADRNGAQNWYRNTTLHGALQCVRDPATGLCKL